MQGMSLFIRRSRPNTSRLFFLSSYRIASYHSLKADIRADTNRDGLVDVTGDSDISGKATWSRDRGAMFLANIGDTHRRCSRAALSSNRKLANDELSACHDASDNVQRAPQYMAPLRTVPLKEISDSAKGFISIPDITQRAFVRIFHRKAKTWFFIEQGNSFSAAELKEGLILGIDARDTRRPNGWDGRVTVRFTVSDGEESSSDDVMLRVAPVVVHHHLERVEQVMAVKGNIASQPSQKDFLRDLANAIEDIGISKPSYLFEGDDQWAQDIVEPGYTSMPGPNGPISIRIMVRSGQDDREAGQQLFTHLRDTGIGAVQQLGGSFHEINSMGNLECIPPFTHDGVHWPSGRIIMGTHGHYQHHLLEFFRAQEIQDPLLLDTGWLWVGHVDEFVQFLPAKTERGWVMVVVDTNAALRLLQQARDDGYGSLDLISRRDNQNIPSVISFNENTYDIVNIPNPYSTINSALRDEKLHMFNAAYQKRIEANIDIIKGATGITDSEIRRIPALFQQLERDKLPDPGPRPTEEMLCAGALFPGVINGVVLTGSGSYLAPKSWGPIIDGRDIVEDAVVKIYKEIGWKVKWIDDWDSHHKQGGEVHCGTNTIREMG